jgi:hypothetical protein
MNVPLLQPDYAAHPMLDPGYLGKSGTGARGLYRMYAGMSATAEDHNRRLNQLLNPLDQPASLPENMETSRRYFVDVNAYVTELVQLLGPGGRRPLAMDPEVAAANDMLGLMGLAFEGDDLRIRFEAQRKLYLAKLLFDIDHDPGIQNGAEHKQYFERILDRELWVHAARMKPVDLYYDIGADGTSIDINTRRTEPGQEKWRFYLMRLRGAPGRKRPIHVYHYACRFKREVAPFSYAAGAEAYEIQEPPIWEKLHVRRSGSVLSKMIRKGEVHPRKIQDIIGAMFIVKDVREVEELQEVLFEVFGGPLRWKDLVNTISRPEDRVRLNPYSGAGYEVLKGDVDVLYGPQDGEANPYIFSVEIQIYTVEGFLRTVHSRHYASHHRLKLRQFLEGLLPYLYPPRVYGEDVVRRCLEEVNPEQVGSQV